MVNSSNRFLASDNAQTKYRYFSVLLPPVITEQDNYGSVLSYTALPSVLETPCKHGGQ